MAELLVKAASAYELMCNIKQEMQIITATPLGTTFYGSLTHTDYSPESTTVSTSRFLAMTFTEGDSSASRTQVLLSQLPVQNSCQLTTQLTGSQAGGYYTPA
jgi:hypothetical protein